MASSTVLIHAIASSLSGVPCLFPVTAIVDEIVTRIWNDNWKDPFHPFVKEPSNLLFKVLITSILGFSITPFKALGIFSTANIVHNMSTTVLHGKNPREKALAITVFALPFFAFSAFFYVAAMAVNSPISFSTATTLFPSSLSILSIVGSCLQSGIEIHRTI